MKLIVGLGNPGSRYAKTRHNVGRRVVETLGKAYKAAWSESKSLKSRWTEIDCGGNSVTLAVPNLFMNESGEAVRRLVAHFGVHFKSDLLVVVDDAALPLGRLRLRASGQDGGHRGLKSIERVLESQDYARLRVGIAPAHPTEALLEEFVLSPFEVEEKHRLEETLERSKESCKLWVSGSMPKAMDYTNKPFPH